MSDKTADVVAIFAHPDDEAFSCGGTMALLTDAGHRVTLICATRGEAGEISDPDLATPETLPMVREQELRNAMSIVGVSDIRFLGYRDSGMAGTAENEDERALVNAKPEDVRSRILAILEEIGPTAVVTFGPDGIYGHPDHIYISECATAAVESWSGVAALYYVAIPRERIAEMAARPTSNFSKLPAEQLAQLGVPLAEVTTTVDAMAEYDRKFAAFTAHRTQIGPEGPFSDLPAEVVRQMLGIERFKRVPLPGRVDTEGLLDRLSPVVATTSVS